MNDMLYIRGVLLGLLVGVALGMLIMLAIVHQQQTGDPAPPIERYQTTWQTQPA